MRRFLPGPEAAALGRRERPPGHDQAGQAGAPHLVDAGDRANATSAVVGKRQSRSLSAPIQANRESCPSPCLRVAFERVWHGMFQSLGLAAFETAEEAWGPLCQRPAREGRPLPCGRVPGPPDLLSEHLDFVGETGPLAGEGETGLVLTTTC